MNDLNEKSKDWPIYFSKSKEIYDNKETGRKEYDHYEKKLENLFAEKEVRKQKDVLTPNFLKKLERNQEKFLKSKEHYLSNCINTYDALDSLLTDRFGLINQPLLDLFNVEKKLFEKFSVKYSLHNDLGVKLEGMKEKFALKSRRMKYDPTIFMKNPNIEHKFSSSKKVIKREESKTFTETKIISNEMKKDPIANLIPVQSQIQPVIKKVYESNKEFDKYENQFSKKDNFNFDDFFTKAATPIEEEIREQQPNIPSTNTLNDFFNMNIQTNQNSFNFRESKEEEAKSRVENEDRKLSQMGQDHFDLFEQLSTRLNHIKEKSSKKVVQDVEKEVVLNAIQIDNNNNLFEKAVKLEVTPNNNNNNNDKSPFEKAFNIMEIQNAVSEAKSEYNAHDLFAAGAKISYPSLKSVLDQRREFDQNSIYAPSIFSRYKDNNNIAQSENASEMNDESRNKFDIEDLLNRNDFFTEFDKKNPRKKTSKELVDPFAGFY
jgi:hypothetical protein